MSVRHAPLPRILLAVLRTVVGVLLPLVRRDEQWTWRPCLQCDERFHIYQLSALRVVCPMEWGGKRWKLRDRLGQHKSLRSALQIARQSCISHEKHHERRYTDASTLWNRHLTGPLLPGVGVRMLRFESCFHWVGRQIALDAKAATGQKQIQGPQLLDSVSNVLGCWMFLSKNVENNRFSAIHLLLQRKNASWWVVRQYSESSFDLSLHHQARKGPCWLRISVLVGWMLLVAMLKGPSFKD